MKYVVLQKDLGETKHEVPIIFPEHCVHAHMVQVVTHTPELRGYKPIAAGFVRLPLEALGRKFPLSCYGESETLGNLKSRGKIDEKLIQWYEYTGGMEGAHVPGL